MANTGHTMLRLSVPEPILGRNVEKGEKEIEVRFISVLEPPVPIPNTEVKRHSAEDTRWATARENRSKRTFLLSSVGRAHDC